MILSNFQLIRFQGDETRSCVLFWPRIIWKCCDFWQWDGEAQLVQGSNCILTKSRQESQWRLSCCCAAILFFLTDGWRISRWVNRVFTNIFKVGCLIRLAFTGKLHLTFYGWLLNKMVMKLGFIAILQLQGSWVQMVQTVNFFGISLPWELWPE